MIWYFPNAFAIFAAGAVNTPTPASAKKMPVRTTNKPIKTRRLKKADVKRISFSWSVEVWGTCPVVGSVC